MINWHDKKVLIMGFSMSGKSAAKYLARHGADVFITENREQKEEDLKDIQELEGFDRFHIEAIINKNVSILSTPIKEYPISNILHTSEFGYISLLPKNDKIAIPCSMIFKLDNAKKIHTTNYLYL